MATKDMAGMADIGNYSQFSYLMDAYFFIVTTISAVGVLLSICLPGVNSMSDVAIHISRFFDDF